MDRNARNVLHQRQTHTAGRPNRPHGPPGPAGRDPINALMQKTANRLPSRPTARIWYGFIETRRLTTA